ncbi:Protein CBG27760 [Caenorhabditis briggsae]|uniref:Uncharacterized protein n=2 Tax=Caenorhabditis briggsae TaxID=6238 RepID=A0AAE8ZQR1_CAEBR|nr:Protein CBG27760 [Caenorhabditis briggsae]ULT82746.1 hypothetical protein L3Y34_012172 [Caenorhabditis briggsae]CAR98814.1 Protein CBG27760 [Caenorhabditis briggsae]
MSFSGTSFGLSLTTALNAINHANDKRATEEVASDEGLVFTMEDVCQELEQLKTQVKIVTNRKPTSGTGAKFKAAKLYEMKKNGKGVGKLDDPFASHVSSLNPWSYYNRDAKFMIHNKKMKKLSDDDVIQLAHFEIGKRIAYHKERCENNENRMHVHFRHKLQELKNRVDRSRAIVLTFVVRSHKEDEIEVLERKLFPFSTRLLLSMD